MLFILSDLIMSVFSSDITVIDFGSRYLKICAFILPAYPIFFLSNGLFMAIKKAEYAMISNLFRNGFNPVMVFVLAKYINASFEIFFLDLGCCKLDILWNLFKYTNYLFKKPFRENERYR